MIDSNRIVLAVNSDLDSWDIENIRYIRKISIRDSETLSFLSGEDETGKNFIVTSATLPNYQSSHPPPTFPTILEEELTPNQELVEVKRHRHQFDQRKAVTLSGGALATAFETGALNLGRIKNDNVMDRCGIQQRPRPVKKSVSFLEHRGLPQIDRKVRSTSLKGWPKKTSNDQDQGHAKNADLGPVETLQLFTLSSTWQRLNVKLMGSEQLQGGYAENWAQLENYVKGLNSPRTR